MSWQDWVLGIIQVVFLLALFPSLWSADKPAFSTSMLTAFGMLVIAWVYATQVWVFSSIAALAMGVVWFMLGVQVYQRRLDQVG